MDDQTAGQAGAAASRAATPGRPGFLAGSVGAIPLRTEAVLDAIKHAILAGELRPGQSLVEADLAQALGVSKTPVREALKTLSGAGLVTMSPYRGATVRAIDDETARAIYDLRLLLEPEAVRRAAAPDAGGREALAGAGQALDRADAASGEAERSLANRDFHRAMYAGCGNPLLVRALDDLRDQTALVSAAAWQQEPSWRHEAGEHRAILDAAAAGDAERAAALLAAHIGDFAARHFRGLAGSASPAPSDAVVSAAEWRPRISRRLGVTGTVGRRGERRRVAPEDLSPARRHRDRRAPW